MELGTRDPRPRLLNGYWENPLSNSLTLWHIAEISPPAATCYYIPCVNLGACLSNFFYNSPEYQNQSYSNLVKPEVIILTRHPSACIIACKKAVLKLLGSLHK